MSRAVVGFVAANFDPESGCLRFVHGAVNPLDDLVHCDHAGLDIGVGEIWYARHLVIEGGLPAVHDGGRRRPRVSTSGVEHSQALGARGHVFLVGITKEHDVDQVARPVVVHFRLSH